MTKRILKQLLAVISLLFPTLLQIRRGSGGLISSSKGTGVTGRSHNEYIYTSLFDVRPNKSRISQADASLNNNSFAGDIASSVNEDEPDENLAELVVTLDPLTTGFLQDLQLIVQLAIDKCTYKVKVGVQNACDFAATALT